MMSKKVFLVLVILMSLSLMGIIFVQAYYITNSVRNEEDQFESKVKKALSDVSNEIGSREYRDYVYKLSKLLNKGGKVPDSTAILDLYLKEEKDGSNEISTYRQGILEESYKLSSTLFDIGLDSTSIKRIINRQETRVIRTDAVDGKTRTNAMLSQFGNITRSMNVLYEDFYDEYAHRKPIHKRVSKEEIDELLRDKLLESNIDIDYEFAIYSNDLATKVKTENFEREQAYVSVPFFNSEKGVSNYKLLVEFPERKKFILSSIMTMLILSVVFTSIIILAYSSALFQLIKQRQISEIKTDFINNMTHEFKTPIATINLALDAIRNPKIIDDKEKVKRYLSMIKEENKRMHAQVENVLRISKLEKNELNISKERVDTHDLVEDAITHVELIIEDRGGTITTDFKAEKTSVLANETHFTNVLVNILDNAIKYSVDAPVINVNTQNVGNNILIKVKDQGSGMSKTAQKRVFEKFYREHTGNIHNVKGHGLGLAYVKRIIEDHHGHISVESEKEKGSTFTIKLPLIS